MGTVSCLPGPTMSVVDSVGPRAPRPVPGVETTASRESRGVMTGSREALPDVDGPGLTLGDRAAIALTEYRAGNRQALGGLVREATPLLWHTVRAQGVDRDAAEDVVQSTWVALVRHAETIEEPKAVLKWLLVTAKRAAWEAVRKHRDDEKRRTELPDDSPEHPMTLPSKDPLPDVEVLRDERDRLLWMSLQKLPGRCQELLRLVSLADRPDYRYISAAIGMPMGSIGSTRGRCLAKLRTILDEQGDFSWA